MDRIVGGFGNRLTGRADREVLYRITMRPNRIPLNLLACAMAIFLMVACGRGAKEAATIEGVFPVDPLFGQFYTRLGGESTLGPAISPIFENQGSFYQYTVSALLVYDPKAETGENFQLAPLGRDMGVAELPNLGAGDDDAATRPVDKKIQPLYQELGGASVVGKPLTGVYKNQEKKRYEQYFENLGFYWVEEDMQAEVILLAYGAWKCDRYCRHKTPLNSSISLPNRSAAPFVQLVATYGLDFTGLALTPPYLNADGSLEQLYENMLMQIGPSAPGTVRLLPLPEKLGVPRDILLPETGEEMYFYQVQEGLGYNVPEYFRDYIWQHGGLDLIGQPITQLIEVDGKVFRQCFLSLCLRAVRTEGGEMQVSPEALGIQYRDIFYQTTSLTAADEGSQDITIQLWEGYPMVSPEQEQEIGLAAFSGGAPLANIVPELDLMLPDGTKIHQLMPPTNQKGESQIVVPALNVENGSLIPYKVCVSTPKGQRFCLVDSYLIWQADFITISPRLSPGNTSYIPFVVRNYQTYIPAVLEEYKIYLPMVTFGSIWEAP